MSSSRHTDNLLGNMEHQGYQNDDADNSSQKQSQSNSQEDYLLIPRQYPIYASPRKDIPIECNSKPFVYKKIDKKQINQNQIQDTINNVNKSQQDSFMLQSRRQTSRKFSTSKKFQQIAMKQVQSQHDIQFPSNEEQDKQRQKQFQQQNISFVSISSQKKSQVSKSNSQVQKQTGFQHDLQQQNENQRNRQINIQIQTKKIVALQQHSNPQSNPIISINLSSQENQIEEVVAKYHFQTQQQFSQQKIDYVNLNEGFSPSLKLIKVSPDQKIQTQNEINITFSPKEQLIKKQDPYKKYKKNAQNSPIQGQKYIQVQKQQVLHNERNLKSNEIKMKNFQQSQNSPNVNFQRNFLEEGQKEYDEKLVKSMQQIDYLRKQLLKSTQNNIKTIFSTKISAQQCQVAQIVDKINKKVGQVCEKVQDIQRKRIIEMEKQLQRRRILSYQRRQKQFQRQEFKIERQIQRQRQKQRQRQRQRQRLRQIQTRRSYESRGDNMILDLGKGSANQGKIIAIYPNNRIVNVKDLILGQSQNNRYKESDEKDKTLKMMLEMQQTFISTLKTFQSSVDQSLNIKLQEIKKAYEKNQQLKKQQIQRQQKLQRISQQTNDRQNQQYDDSRGSINVIYLRKLRQLQEEVREKQWKIQRLQKQNYYMEKQFEKVQQVGFVKKGRQSRIDIVSPLKHNNLYGENLSFNNQSRRLQHENNYSQAPVSPLQTYNGQDHNINFSFSPKAQHYNQQNYPSPFSSQQNQQKINQPATMTNQQLTYFSSQNAHSKKKSTHSFHHYQSKIIQSKQIVQMKQKLSQFELLIKQKDFRIKQLENTIMDHLESSRKWKKDIEQQSQNSRSSKISGYSSVNSKQQSNQILHMKINNLKTLLKQSKNQVEHFKRLYEAQKASNTTAPSSNQNIKLQNVKTGSDDMKSNTNTSRSLCVSDKTTIKNERQINNERAGNSPFVEITETQTVGQKSRQVLSYGKQTIFESLINENGAVSIITGALVNFIMMAWSLKEVITKLCGKQVNVQKINRNARQFLTQLKEKDQNIWRKVWLKLDEGQFDSRIRQIWSQ